MSWSMAFAVRWWHRVRRCPPCWQWLAQAEWKRWRHNYISILILLVAELSFPGCPVGLVAVCSWCCRLSDADPPIPALAPFPLLSHSLAHLGCLGASSPIHIQRKPKMPSLFLLLLEPASDENCHSDPTSTCQPLQTLGIVLSSEQVVLILRPCNLSSPGTSYEKWKMGFFFHCWCWKTVGLPRAWPVLLRWTQQPLNSTSGNPREAWWFLSLAFHSPTFQSLGLGRTFRKSLEFQCLQALAPTEDGTILEEAFWKVLQDYIWLVPKLRGIVGM